MLVTAMVHVGRQASANAKMDGSLRTVVNNVQQPAQIVRRTKGSAQALPAYCSVFARLDITAKIAHKNVQDPLGRVLVTVLALSRMPEIWSAPVNLIGQAKVVTHPVPVIAICPYPARDMEHVFKTMVWANVHAFHRGLVEIVAVPN